MIDRRGPIRTTVLAAVCCFSLLGCGVKDAVTTALSPGSCTVTTSGMALCYDFTGAAWTTGASVQTQCTTNGWLYVKTACTTTDRVGSCQISPGGSAEMLLRYYKPLPPDAASAQTACPESATQHFIAG